MWVQGSSDWGGVLHLQPPFRSLFPGMLTLAQIPGVELGAEGGREAQRGGADRTTCREETGASGSIFSKRFLEGRRNGCALEGESWVEKATLTAGLAEEDPWSPLKQGRLVLESESV